MRIKSSLEKVSANRRRNYQDRSGFSVFVSLIDFCHNKGYNITIIFREVSR